MNAEPGETQKSPSRLAHPEWPYEPKFRRVNGWRMHYIDEGAGDPVVLLHGNPAWGFLYRKFVKPLVAAVGLAGTIASVWWFALKPRRMRARQRSSAPPTTE